jgi:uncharacterized DUF497 family protein
VSAGHIVSHTVTWDEAKRDANIDKHGYDFVGIAAVFDGRFTLTREDRRQDYGESRYNMLVEYQGAIVNVTFAPHAEGYRLISARPASRRERSAYHAAKEAL